MTSICKNCGEYIYREADQGPTRVWKHEGNGNRACGHYAEPIADGLFNINELVKTAYKEGIDAADKDSAITSTEDELWDKSRVKLLLTT